MKFKSLIFCFLVVSVYSCGPKELTEEELAQVHFQKSDSLFNLHKLNAAKMQIDTINKLFPRQVAIRKQAKEPWWCLSAVSGQNSIIWRF